MDSDGYFMLPELWDDLIEPGMEITMTMWPKENQPSPQKPSTLPMRPTQSTNLEESSQPRQPFKKNRRIPWYHIWRNAEPLKQSPRRLLSAPSSSNQKKAVERAGRGAGAKKQLLRNKTAGWYSLVLLVSCLISCDCFTTIQTEVLQDDLDNFQI